MDMSEYKEVFKTESEEHLQQLNESLLELERDMENMEHINIMFRSAHTLKGMAATMGFTTIAELTHEMENVMDKIRSHKAKLDTAAIDTLFECLDTLEALVENIDSDGGVDISHLQCQLKGIMADECAITPPSEEGTEQTEQPSSEDKISEVATEPVAESSATPLDIEFNDGEQSVIDMAQKDGVNVIVAKISLDEGCLLKAARSTLVMRNISEMGDIIKTVPSVDDLEDENFDFDFSVVFSTKNDIDSAKTRIANVSEVKEVVLSPLAVAETAQTDKTAGEKTSSNKTKTETKPKAGAGGAVKRTDAIKSVQSVRVSIERLDNLMNLVGELIINKIRLNQLASEIDAKNLDEALANLDRLTNEIQTEVMESRMVPIDQIFSRFPRMVRDLAKSEGKEINLVIEGKEIELDRTVLDEIGDPLVHLLRNSVDHGVEEIEKRTQLGKPAAGMVRLAASRQRNNVVIEVEDDGKGMNPARMREIAVKKGMLTEAEVNKLSDTDAL
ncbi:MAG: chemotaxis protein CheA, partial [Methanosarcinales archaeon]|nr:chemotaxis protein CheA [Methanosarcinales archaeon]